MEEGSRTSLHQHCECCDYHKHHDHYEHPKHHEGPLTLKILFR